MNVDMVLTYLDFVVDRHRVWEKRRRQEPAPWSADPILQQRKFTNVYRVLDFGSQYVLTDLCEPDLSERDTLMRLFLYRHTGRVEAWKYLREELGEYPTAENLDEVLRAWQRYRGEFTLSVRGEENNPKAGRPGAIKRVSAKPVFTGAYLVFPQSQTPGTDKLESIIRLTQRLFTPGSPDDLVPDFLRAGTQAERFAALRRNKGVADFMSMQILTDWGYSPFGQDLENEFVVPGPGARKGAAELWPNHKAEDVIRRCRALLLASSDCPDLHGRPPSMMDIQNTLCEFSKYARYMRKPKSAKLFSPDHPGAPLPLVLPKHWTTV